MYNNILLITYLFQILILFLFFILLSRLLFAWSYHHLSQRLSLLKLPTTPPKWLLSIMFVKHSIHDKPHAIAFQRAGIQMSYTYYIVIYRVANILIMSALICFTVLWLVYQVQLLGLLLLLTLLCLTFLLCEPWWLNLWIKHRTKLIIYDIYQLSYHLLYFAESNMNIYYKIKKCMPYTTTIRRDLDILLMEWTQDSDYALRRLKMRLACPEAISFIDTVSALKQHQDESFYELLRERITEYKEQLDISNDSKKETSSYILFVLAGIPILYTFQLFIYPWVKEVQKLLMQLN